jgi:hypothetical protein
VHYLLGFSTHRETGLDRRDFDDTSPIANVGRDPARCPLEIVVEFDPAGEKGAPTDKVGDPATLTQVVDKREIACGIPQRHQVLQKRYLHARTWEQHVPVPPESRLSFHEDGAHAPLRQRNRQREIRRPETNAEQAGIRMFRGRHENESTVEDSVRAPWPG